MADVDPTAAPPPPDRPLAGPVPPEALPDGPLPADPGRRERLRAAAIEAERGTGNRERTDEQANRNIVVRIAIIAFGTLVTLVGIGMLVLPGPGIVVVIAGLGILATEVSWAERLLAYAKKKANVESVTAQHPWIKPVSIVLMVLGVAASVLYTFRWR